MSFYKWSSYLMNGCRFSMNGCYSPINGIFRLLKNPFFNRKKAKKCYYNTQQQCLSYRKKSCFFEAELLKNDFFIVNFYRFTIFCVIIPFSVVIRTKYIPAGKEEISIAPPSPPEGGDVTDITTLPIKSNISIFSIVTSLRA